MESFYDKICRLTEQKQLQSNFGKILLHWVEHESKWKQAVEDAANDGLTSVQLKIPHHMQDALNEYVYSDSITFFLDHFKPFSADIKNIKLSTYLVLSWSPKELHV